MVKEPLAYRMMPETFDEYVGQEQILGKGKLLRRMVDSKHLNNLILHGNPGIGKTALVNVLANELHLNLYKYNAATNNKKDLTEAIKEISGQDGGILFVDEIHRMTKNVMDYLLPFTEDGTVTLIGATTEVPYFSVNEAILSRCTVLQLLPLTKANKMEIVVKAIHSQKGLLNLNVNLSEDACEALVDLGGDIRNILNTLEVLANSTPLVKDERTITLEDIKGALTTNGYYVDEERMHWLKSCLQKSIRGSDVNASIFYLSSLLQGDLLDEACRRLPIIVAEDIGLANPQLIGRVYSAIQIAQKIGMPEAEIILAEVVAEMALSPKSNVTHDAIKLADVDVLAGKGALLPTYLKTNSKNYKYPFDFPNNIVKQQYLPDDLAQKEYLKFTGKSKNEQAFAMQYQKLQEFFNK